MRAAGCDDIEAVNRYELNSIQPHACCIMSVQYNSIVIPGALDSQIPLQTNTQVWLAWEQLMFKQPFANKANYAVVVARHLLLPTGCQQVL
jgi:hypothetical protein